MRPGNLAETNSAFSRASSKAMLSGAVRPELPCTARSSISAGTASKAMPALASSVCRARLCEARISGCLPRQMVMTGKSFGRPVALPVGIKLHHGRGGFLNRTPRHVQQRPVEFGAQAPCERDLVGYRLLVDIGVVVVVAHAQQPVLPDLDQTFRRRMQADDQRLFQMFEL